MRRGLLLVSPMLLMLAGCAQFGGNQPATGGNSQLNNPDACGASGFQSYVGQRVDTRGIEGHPRIRVIRPGQAVTQDYVTERINWSLDANDRVMRVYCG